MPQESQHQQLAACLSRLEDDGIHDSMEGAIELRSEFFGLIHLQLPLAILS